MPKVYRRVGIITIVAVYLLILVGGVVRSTGSGLGCPDWPRCFGRWIPPTEVSQLPVDYKEKFKIAGKTIADFDAFKTWTEYLNRLLGVLIGFFVFITFLLSFSYYKSDRAVFFASLFVFLLTGFQGWLGAVVVSTHLKPLIVTLHLAVALIIVAVLIYGVVRSFRASLPSMPRLDSKISILLWLCLLTTFAQVVLGTQVRQAIDEIAAQLNYVARETWIEQVGTAFYIHRTFSLLILGLHIYLIVLMKKSQINALVQWATVLLGVVILEIISGVVMAYFSLPPAVQPVHLLLASVAFGVQFIVLLLMFFSKIKQ